MQPTPRAWLVLICLTILVSTILQSDAAVANPGDQIRQFLIELAEKHQAVELDQVKTALEPEDVSAAPLTEGKFKGAYLPVGCCGDNARQKLNDALQVSSQPLPPTFTPDYCVVHWTDSGKSQVLWISSATPVLQMRYYASNGIFDQCGIKQSTTGDSVHTKLDTIFNTAPSVVLSNVLKACAAETPRVRFKLMSVDPTPVQDVFGQKNWKTLGEINVSEDTADDNKRDEILEGMALAVVLHPLYAARDAFTPRLALLAHIPRGAEDVAEGNYLVLMSFECQLAQLYVNGKPKGCFTIASGYLPKNEPDKPGLAIEIGTDQLLNDILVKAGKPLRPKSASSGK